MINDKVTLLDNLDIMVSNFCYIKKYKMWFLCVFNNCICLCLNILSMNKDILGGKKTIRVLFGWTEITQVFIITRQIS